MQNHSVFSRRNSGAYILFAMDRHVLLLGRLKIVVGQYRPSLKHLLGNTFALKMIVGQFTYAHTHEAIILIGRSLSCACVYIFFILSLILKKNKEICEIIEFYTKDSFYKTVLQLSSCVQSVFCKLLVLFVFYVIKIVYILSLISLDSSQNGGVACI